MGICTGKAHRGVAERQDDDAGLAAPPRTCSHLHSAREHDVASAVDRKQHKKKKSGASSVSSGVGATGGVAATGASTPGPSPNLPTGNAVNDATQDDRRKHHHHQRKQSLDGQKSPPDHGAVGHDASAAPHVPEKAEMEGDNSSGSPRTFSDMHSPSRDSIAARIEQGSTYVWLRSTYSNPNLKASPLLTIDCMRALRNKNVAFQHLWSVLGESGCVIGPYAAAPSLVSLPSLRETDDCKNNNGVEPSLVNDEARRGTRDAADRQTSANSAGPSSPPPQQEQQQAQALQQADDAKRTDTNEVRVLSQQHISIEGDETLQHPIVCCGAVCRGKYFWIHKLRSRCCFIFAHTSGVDLRDCNDALIVLGPTAGVVSVSNCHRCLIVAATAQLRVLSCSSLILSVNVAGFPVIEKSNRIGITSLLGWYAYSSLPIDFRHASLSLFTNNYSTVRDVTPPPPPPPTSTTTTSNAGAAPVQPADPGGAALLLPASNFVYVDLWELEMAVWKAMAEQRWVQLISDTDNAAVTAAATRNLDGEKQGNASQQDSRAPPATDATPASPSMGDVESGTAGAHRAPHAKASGGNLKNDRNSHNDDADDDLVHNDSVYVDFDTSHNTKHENDGNFHSMISFGQFSPSFTSCANNKGSGTAEDLRELSRNMHRDKSAFPASVLGASSTDNSVPPLPRWRQSGFNGNVATDGAPPAVHNNATLRSNSNSNNNTQGARKCSTMHDAMMQQRRGSARDAEHLVREVLRAVPLLPLSALHEASRLLLGDEADLAVAEDDTSIRTSDTAKGRKATDVATADPARKQKALTSCYNPLELALAIYTHTCAVPATFGAQLIPADFFEQAWKLKLIVLTVKGGGYDVARRIIGDVEASRRRCFLETVRAMLHAPPPPPSPSPSEQVDGAAKGSSTGKQAKQKVALPQGDDEEDMFSEVLWHYLRTTSLTQRCGSVLLLNTVELRCTETTVRDFVAPVFFKLCEPATTSKSASAAANGNTNNTNNISRGLHLPWKTGSSSNNYNSSPEQQQQLEHNVEMRRLFGTAIQRMTGQTCIALLALLAPKSVPPSFQRPPGTGERSIGGALTPAELDAWAMRAEEARRIFTPKKDTTEASHVAGGDPTRHQPPSVPRASNDEPTAADTLVNERDKNRSRGSSEDAEAAEAQKQVPTFAPPQDGEPVPQSMEEQVWPKTVLLNVTVPLRFVSLLQGTLFFKSQMHVAATAGAQQMRMQEPRKKA
ncbi:Tubulin binding cofactor C [Lotmaria passim]